MHILKPLDPDDHKTGRWNFSGKNLPPEEVQALTEKGVNWGKDIMPDGRLKHPRFRLRRLSNRQKGLDAPKKRSEVENLELRVRYKELPDPKPNYFQWAAQEEIYFHYENVKRLASHSRRDGDRIKALSVLLEHGLSKPKTISEVNTKGQDVQDVSMDKLLEMLILNLGPAAVQEKLNQMALQIQ